jgi:hypothetical protein
MFQEWLALHDGLYAQKVVTRTGWTIKFGRYVEERMAAVGADSRGKTLSALEE